MIKKNKKTSKKTNPHILVVEDEHIVAKDLQNRLDSLGYTVLAAVFSGEEAIEKTEKMHPDLVLMDIKLKGKIDGIKAAKQIRKRFHIPIIYITAYADEKTLKRAKTTGPYGYILKPFEDRELRANIETALFKHKMEKKLKKSEEKYRDLFENANDLIQIVNKKGRFVDINRKWLQLLGFTKKEVKKITLWDVLRKDQIPHCRKLLKRVYSGESLEGIEVVFVSKNGKEIFVEGNANARFKNGKFVSTRGIFRDITERKKAEEELRKKILELERFNKITMGREIRILELKEEITQLKAELETKSGNKKSTSLK